MRPIPIILAVALTAEAVYVAHCVPPQHYTPVIQIRFIDAVVDHTHGEIVPAIYLVT